MRLTALILALAACAANPQLPTTPAATVAPARNDCPGGTAPLSNSRGSACWPLGNDPPADHCRPERCPLTGYMLWNCEHLPPQDALIGMEEVFETEQTQLGECVGHLGVGNEYAGHYYRNRDGQCQFCPFKRTAECAQVWNSHPHPLEEECLDYGQCHPVGCNPTGPIMW